LGVVGDTPRASTISVDEVRTVLAASVETARASSTEAVSEKKSTTPTQRDGVYSVPYVSQLHDITSPTWSKNGCGVASLAMLIEYYNPGSVEVNELLDEGIAAGAYITNVGWAYAGLIGISRPYGLTGASYDLAGHTMDAAFTAFTEALKKGPVMASVHYTFDPKNPIPHLVIVTGVKDGRLYFNDPGFGKPGDSIPVSQFKNSWKKRYIEFWPVS